MPEVIIGKSPHPMQTQALREALLNSDIVGTLFIGYPVIASTDETMVIDAALVSDVHGLIVFHVPEEAPASSTDSRKWIALKERQDEILYSVRANLSRNRDLRRGAELGVPVSIVSLLPQDVEPPSQVTVNAIAISRVPAWITQQERAPVELVRALHAAIQRVSTIKPTRKRTVAKSPNSRGSVLKKIEREIANLDKWQNQAAVECPDGPQRIRGLAGSGKTIVLALKAAYLHAQNPEWEIGITFYTRSLYQQFRDLVRRFIFDHTNDEPDWDRIHLFHAWGSYDKAGLYTTMARRSGLVARDFAYAKRMYGRAHSFHGICQELVSHIEQQSVEPFLDVLLIDEAQDLPAPFFRLAYRAVKEPKMLVWAYDELQNLSDFQMPPVQEQFGQREDGSPAITLQNEDGQPHKDVILRTCYRNTPWALVTAHSLGFGVYRDGGLVQFFDEPQLWDDIGYEAVKGQVSPGKKVTLRRRQGSYPEYFESLLSPDDAIVTMTFADRDEQAQWVAAEISKNLGNDELEHEDVLVILPEPYTLRSEAEAVIRALQNLGISAHVAGISSSQDELFQKRSVAICHIHRAKGNEAPVVYVLNAHECYSGSELTKRRNTLFTAITRSRAWVRIVGIGSEMKSLSKEIDEVRNNNFQMIFKVPSATEIARLRTIHRDMSEEERAKLRKIKQKLEETKRLLVDLNLEEIPQELLDQLDGLRELRGSNDDAP